MAMDDSDKDQESGGANVTISIVPPRVALDFATIIGLISAVGLILAAIAMGHSNANFFNGPSFMIVILGTIAATAISYSPAEMAKAWFVMGKTVIRQVRHPSQMARQLLDIAVLARKKGILALAGAERELKKDPFLGRAVQLVTDGYSPEDIQRILSQEIDSVVERHRRGASILRRASEVAPAMGLIGTLVGLVQMLAQLDDPATIGPAMAVALLTTFYGAILGTVIMAPMAAKLERNSNDEALIKNLVLTAMVAISNQENPVVLKLS